MSTHAGEERIEACAAVRTAAYNAYGHATRVGHADLEWLTAAIPEFRAMAFAADVSLLLHGYMDNAEDRAPSLYQRNIDREFAISIDELPGAVEWIDQPVTLPQAAFVKGREAGFLGDYGNVGRQVFEFGNNALLRCEICPRER